MTWMPERSIAPIKSLMQPFGDLKSTLNVMATRVVYVAAEMGTGAASFEGSFDERKRLMRALDSALTARRPNSLDSAEHVLARTV